MDKFASGLSFTKYTPKKIPEGFPENVLFYGATLNGVHYDWYEFRNVMDSQTYKVLATQDGFIALCKQDGSMIAPMGHIFYQFSEEEVPEELRGGLANNPHLVGKYIVAEGRIFETRQYMTTIYNKQLQRQLTEVDGSIQHLQDLVDIGEAESSDLESIQLLKKKRVAIRRTTPEQVEAYGWPT